MISNELDITNHMITSKLSGHCVVISNRLWRLQQNVNRASKTRRSMFLSSFMDSLCHVRNKFMYVLLQQTVSALICMLFWCLFPELPLHELRNRLPLEYIYYSLYIISCFQWCHRVHYEDERSATKRVTCLTSQSALCLLKAWHH